ncbi:CobW family GTP-binding protein [Anaerosalibacter sp. Marseille-P3206]|uniref:CobW family GTP-binding protein n=1 Tax=Anaerosalibacter sp. Marseille-P3206 TaxID=1871005 RepID=UPI000985C28C|nr:GTP-binding protein [Anaerosalibacter sp. Marseille-P3206]
MSEKTDLYLLTGFLGAGKTTLLTNILNDLSGESVGVIMNEFGKIGIDGDIIKKEGMELVEINRGSIFCSCLKLNFAQAMVELADKNLKYLFVESSGLADPSNIGDILDGVKSVKGDVYEYKGAICLVDGVNFLEQVKDLETVERQIKHCHLAVISKVDLIDEETLTKIIEVIRKINNKVNIETTAFGKLNYKFLEEDLMKNQWVENEDTTNTPETKPKTLTLTFEGEVNKDELSRFINEIKKDSYRIKGFFKLEDGWNQVDVVGNIIDYKPTDKNEEISQLVIISKIGPQIIRPIFNAWNSIFKEEMKLR